jgi:hypothetical protein
MAKQTAAQRLTSAVNRLEEATTQLLRQAERFSYQVTSDTDQQWRRRSLLEAGRLYGKALDRLSRVRR